MAKTRFAKEWCEKSKLWCSQKLWRCKETTFNSESFRGRSAFTIEVHIIVCVNFCIPNHEGKIRKHEIRSDQPTFDCLWSIGFKWVTRLRIFFITSFDTLIADSFCRNFQIGSRSFHNVMNILWEKGKSEQAYQYTRTQQVMMLQNRTRPRSQETVAAWE